jgi:acyl-CoA reductase-like NAD-dependent aldehyde dehydrogenase
VTTTTGPVVSISAAARIRKQISDAITAGAKAEIPSGTFAMDKEGSAFVGPQVLTNVNHAMSISISLLISGVMTEETFGPVVGIQKVSSDEEAIILMNDSEFGLTGSIWTKNIDGKAEDLADQVEAGTVFINRYPPCKPLIQFRLSRSSTRMDRRQKFWSRMYPIQIRIRAIYPL